MPCARNHLILIQDIDDLFTIAGIFSGHGDPMDSYTEFYWKRIPQNDPESLEPTWTTPYMVHHMTPNVKLFYMLRDPIERLYCLDFHSLPHE